MAPLDTAVRTITADDLPLMDELLDLFATAFDDSVAYRSARPSQDYLRRLLGSDTFIALVATRDGTTAGGLAAYALRKFEQERTEVYIYDLAVAEEHRRTGIATALIRKLQGMAAARNAYVIFVQADLGDAPAIALYRSLGVQEDVLHFDIAVPDSLRGTMG
jgi:aminoglycoside 3-N-acetyltransferase I